MARIRTEQLQKGMVVARPVKNHDNILLIPEGCELSERQITILQAWGISEVEVQGAASEAEADPLAHLSPEVVAEITKAIKQRFWRPDEGSPEFDELVKLLVERRARKPMSA